MRRAVKSISAVAKTLSSYLYISDSYRIVFTIADLQECARLSYHRKTQ